MTWEGATIQALMGNIEALNETIANQDKTIKSLEQQASAINKIREEIESHCGLATENHCSYCPYCTNMMGVREILEIIDKYKI